jgi:hypothetical protein
MSYIVVALIATVATFLGGGSAVVRRNIVHVTNGRAPNAGWSVFPSMPCVPMFWMGVAWLLDQLQTGLGLWVVGGLFVLFVPMWWWRFRALRRELASLQLRQPNSAKQPTSAPSGARG